MGALGEPARQLHRHAGRTMQVRVRLHGYRGKPERSKRSARLKLAYRTTPRAAPLAGFLGRTGSDFAESGEDDLVSVLNFLGIHAIRSIEHQRHLFRCKSRNLLVCLRGRTGSSRLNGILVFLPFTRFRPVVFAATNTDACSSIFDIPSVLPAPRFLLCRNPRCVRTGLLSVLDSLFAYAGNQFRPHHRRRGMMPFVLMAAWEVV